MVDHAHNGARGFRRLRRRSIDDAAVAFGLSLDIIGLSQPGRPYRPRWSFVTMPAVAIRRRCWRRLAWETGKRCDKASAVEGPPARAVTIASVVFVTIAGIASFTTASVTTAF
jgi:hypothetical protein